MNRQRALTYREQRKLDKITGDILRTLRPVEREIEWYFRNLAEARSKTHVTAKNTSSVRLASDMARDTRNALRVLKSSMAKGDTLSLASFAYSYMVAYEQAVVAGMIGATEIANREAYRQSLYMVVDAVARLGTFYTGKLGVATLSTIPFALTVYLDQDPEEMLGELTEDDYLVEPLAEATHDVSGQMGNALVEIIRHKMKVLPIPIAGGGASRPITSSGGLAEAIGVLDDSPRRFARGKIAAREVQAVTVGLRDGHGRTGIYGRVLNRTAPSKVPNASLFTGEIWQRFQAWGAIHGIDGRALHNIVASIQAKGTRGRGWFSHIVSNITDVNVPEQLLDRFVEHLEERINTPEEKL